MVSFQNQAYLPALCSFSETTRRLPRLLAVVGLAASLALGLALPRSGAAAGTGEQAEAFLENLSQEAIQRLKGEEKSQQDREREFRQLLEKAFDIEAISQFVLGRYWRTASDEEKQRFTGVLKDVVVQRFMPLFIDYEGEGLAVQQTVVDEGRNLVTVITSTEFQGQQVRLDWRLRPRADSFKIVDVVVEGASLVITYRSEYGAFIKQNGGRVASLIDDLRDKLERGAFKPENTVGSSKS